MHRLGRLCDQQLRLLDVHKLDLSAERKALLLKTLHLEDADGNMKQGVAANVAAWQHTRFGFIAGILNWPIINPIANLVYDWWAKRRYQRLYGKADPASQNKHA